MVEQKLKTVFNLKIAKELIKAGFSPVKVETNYEDDNYLVFKFVASDLLITTFEKIKQNYMGLELVENR